MDKTTILKVRKIKVLEDIYGLGYGGIRACIQNYISKIDREENEFIKKTKRRNKKVRRSGN